MKKTITRMEIEDFLIDHFDIDTYELIQNEDKPGWLKNGFGADSFDFAEMQYKIEKKYNIEIPYINTIKNFSFVELVNYLTNLCNGTPVQDTQKNTETPCKPVSAPHTKKTSNKKSAFDYTQIDIFKKLFSLFRKSDMQIQKDKRDKETANNLIKYLQSVNVVQSGNELFQTDDFKIICEPVVNKICVTDIKTKEILFTTKDVQKYSVIKELLNERCVKTEIKKYEIFNERLKKLINQNTQ